MAYTAEQRRIIRRIRVIAREVGASPKQVKAAFETGRVESNFSNSARMTDHDSQGWRQERASLYPDPTNLDASIRRFFRETAPLRTKYGRAGDLAAAVQRPAAQYRGRYQAVSGEAQRLLDGMGLVGAPAKPRASSSTSTTTTTTPGVDNSAARAQLVSQFLGTRGKPDVLSFATGIKALKDTPAVTRASRTPAVRAPARTGEPAAGKPSRGASGRSPLFELFWQGPDGINVKNGRKVPQGFVGGHDTHVHVAAGPRTVDNLGRLAQRMGLTVRENETFDHVDPVHVQGSYHYRNRAIDVSGDARKLARFAHTVARSYGVK